MFQLESSRLILVGTLFYILIFATISSFGVGIGP